MSSESLRLHPEVEGLLREIAAQPESMLLRVPRLPRADAFSSTRSELGGLESWLSRAERHLVDVHREEVASALRQAAWLRLATEGFGRSRVYSTITAETLVPVPTRREVGVTAGRALEGVAAAGIDVGARQFLESLVAPGPSALPSPVALLVAAHRLIPNERARVLAGAAWAVAGRRGAARFVLAEAVHSCLATEHLAVAWSNLADILDESDRPDLAMRAGSRAIQYLPGMIPAESGMFWYALRCRRRDLAVARARALDLACAKKPDALHEVERRWSEMRVHAAARLGAAGLQLVRGISLEVGAGARRLIDALS